MAQADSESVQVPKDCVEQTIVAFTDLDESGDKRTMHKMARRLEKEQPALLGQAAKIREEHGELVGKAAVFYSTLVWAIFDRHQGKCPRLTTDNIDAAREVVDEARGAIEGLDDRPLLEQVADDLVDRQPHIYAKLRELLDEDIKADEISAETAELIYPPTQVIVEAFDAAIDGRRPGERVGPLVRDQPKVGRNEPCPCGSGKKYKKCCGRN